MTQKETIKKVLHYIRRYRFFLIASLVLALITVVLTLYVPILTGQAVDLIVGKGQVDFARCLSHLCENRNCYFAYDGGTVGDECC